MAYIDNLQANWDKLGKDNAMWAVLSDKKQWNEKEFFATGRKEIKRVLDTLSAKNVKANFGHALDFGCGVGRLSQALSQHFKKVTGIDIAQSMIKQAKAFSKQKNVDFKHITSGDLSAFKDASFDFAFTDIVFQHMNNGLAKGYMKEMHRVLKKDGLFVFQLPSKPAKTWKGLLISTLPEPVLNKLRKGMEMHPIRKEHVLEYVKDLGFEVVAVEKDANHKHWDAYFYYLQKP